MSSNQRYHARQVMHHFQQIDLDELREESPHDDDSVVNAFRKAEDLFMDVDDAMDAIVQVSEEGL